MRGTIKNHWPKAWLHLTASRAWPEIDCLHHDHHESVYSVPSSRMQGPRPPETGFASLETCFLNHQEVAKPLDVAQQKFPWMWPNQFPVSTCQHPCLLEFADVSHKPQGSPYFPLRHHPQRHSPFMGQKGDEPCPQCLEGPGHLAARDQVRRPTAKGAAPKRRPNAAFQLGPKEPTAKWDLLDFHPVSG